MFWKLYFCQIPDLKPAGHRIHQLHQHNYEAISHRVAVPHVGSQHLVVKCKLISSYNLRLFVVFPNFPSSKWYYQLNIKWIFCLFCHIQPTGCCSRRSWRFVFKYHIISQLIFRDKIKINIRRQTLFPLTHFRRTNICCTCQTWVRFNSRQITGIAWVIQKSLLSHISVSFFKA